MNRNQIEANKTQIEGATDEKCSRLTEDDVAVDAGKRSVLSGKLQDRSSYARGEAQRAIESFLKTVEP